MLSMEEKYLRLTVYAFYPLLLYVLRFTLYAFYRCPTLALSSKIISYAGRSCMPWVVHGNKTEDMQHFHASNSQIFVHKIYASNPSWGIRCGRKLSHKINSAIVSNHRPRIMHATDHSLVACRLSILLKLVSALNKQLTSLIWQVLLLLVSLYDAVTTRSVRACTVTQCS